MARMSAEVIEDTDFLKDQIHRLNVSLGQYQKKHSRGSSIEEHLDSKGDKAPWLTNKRILAPLLDEYDRAMDEQNQQISMYQTEVESMCARVEKVTQENSRLHAELRKSLEARMEAVTNSFQQHESTGGSITGASVARARLEHQLDAVTKDRDNYRDLFKKASQELELLQQNEQDKSRQLLECRAQLTEAQQASIVANRNAAELELTCAKLDEERNRCLKTVKAQEAELSAGQDGLSKLKAELKAANSKNEDLKKSLDEITFQLKRRESERAKILDTENSLDDRLRIMQMTNADLEGKLLATQRENVVLSEEKTDLAETLSSVQARVSVLEQREYEAVCHVKESVQIAESALLEKEQAAIREQQLAKEVERQKLVMSTILKEAGERTRREVDTLREECNKNIDKMGVEIHRLEQECARQQAQLERCQREKKAVEKELEKVLEQKPLEVAQTGENLHELQKRVCVAERARDDTRVKLEALTATNRRLESNLSDLKQDHAQLDEEHRRFQRRVQEESEKLREQKIKAMGDADNLKQRLRQSLQGKEAAELRLLQELAAMERKQEVKEREVRYRLESSEEAHQKSIQELRSLLTAQHKVGTKWREESKALAGKFEKTISDLKSELVRYRSRAEELTKQLHHTKRVKDDLEQQLKTAAQSNASLRERLKEVELQNETTMEEVTELVAREKQLRHERRELSRQLDRVKLHVSRSAESMLPDSMRRMHSTTLSRLPMQHTSASLSHSRTHPHDSSYVFPPPPPPPGPVEKSSEWNHTLSQLRHSIQKVKQDLGFAGERELERTQVGRAGGLGQEVEEEEEDTVSEQSMLSRKDLSHSLS